MNLRQLYLFTFFLLISCTASKVMEIPEDYGQMIENHRNKYKADFLKADPSPLTEADLPNLRFYPADETFNVTATFTKTENGKSIEFATSSGMKKSYIEYGKATFTIRDTTCTLSIYMSLQLRAIPQYQDYLFLPFKDFTSAETTYGGGRYLDLKTSDIKDNQTIVLDFNKCYNPYCAYQSTGWNCPIPPDDNHLKMHIEAGEMDFH